MSDNSATEYAVLECRQEFGQCVCLARHVRNVEIQAFVRDKELRIFFISQSTIPKLKDGLPILQTLNPKRNRVEITRDFNKLNGNTIGVLQGDYKGTRQLQRSAFAALRTCTRRNQSVVVFVALEPSLFSEAWKQQLDATPQPAPRKVVPELETPLERMLRVLEPDPVPERLRGEYIGNAPPVQLVHQLILRAAKHSCPVLIQGESGTGKEIVARNIHEFARLNGSGSEFRPINCSAISPYLLESELFGHVKGAFVGATRNRHGLWKAAGNGTIFLDEVGDLNLDHQAKILRALDTNKVKPVGSDTEVDVHARVLSATNRDLFAMVKLGTFREDLYFRLCVIPIHTPPLREHPEDIPVISRWLWSEITGATAPRLSSEIVDSLTEHTWPGNIREMKAVLSSLFIHYGTRAKTREQFETVMFLTGRSAGLPASQTSMGSPLRTRIEYLQHLNMADKALRGIEVYLNALGAKRNRTAPEKADAQTALRERHRDLLQLCEQPLLFSSERVFEAVHSVCGKVAYILELAAANPQSMNRKTTRELTTQLKSARTLTLKQIDLHMSTPRGQRS